MKRYLNAAQPYLGGKRKIARQILQTIASDYDVRPGSTLADAFAGGCAVSMAAKLLGYRVIGNDRGPIAIATGKALIENKNRTLTREQQAMALEHPPIDDLPDEKELSIPAGCRSTLAKMTGAMRSAEGAEAWLLQAWIARTALSMSSWGIPTMGAGRREFDEMTPGQATQLTRTGKPVSMALRAAKTINQGVFDNGLKNEMRIGDAVEFLGEVEADVAYLDPPYPGTLAYEQVYCNPPEAPVWMGDFTFKAIGEIQPGDTVIGWSGGTSEKRAKLCRAEVLATARRRAQIVKVTMESGRVIRCTPDHQWLSGGSRNIGSLASNGWTKAEVGKNLVHIVDEPTGTTPREWMAAAYIAGIYDGEGCKDFISQSPTHNPHVCRRIAGELTILGIPFTQTKRGFQLTGGRQALARLAALGQPTRIESLDQQILTSRFRSRDRVIAVEPDGEGDVISMQTTTGNYTAWGYASKNCGINHLLDPSLPTTPSPWSDADGWKLLREAFAASENIPLVVISMGKGADPDEISEMMNEAGREPSWRSLDHKHLSALKREHDPDGDELLLIGRKR